jgi:putative transposase
MYDPDIHHRRSIRLRGYDYSQPGMYYVTICTHGKGHLFGEVVEGEMHLNEYGKMVALDWGDLPRHYPHIRLDASVVMPNHVHGIIEIVGASLQTCPVRESMSVVGAGLQTRPVRESMPVVGHGLPEIVRGFKTYSARHLFRTTS